MDACACVCVCVCVIPHGGFANDDLHDGEALPIWVGEEWDQEGRVKEGAMGRVL
jgi:hypothetical protein